MTVIHAQTWDTLILSLKTRIGHLNLKHGVKSIITFKLWRVGVWHYICVFKRSFSSALQSVESRDARVYMEQ